MAQSLEDAEFWLPPRFLTDDDVFMDKKNNCGGGIGAGFGPTAGFPSEFPYEFDSFSSNSPLSSPVESVVGSTETESSDEEDFFVGLTRRLAQSTIHDSQKLAVSNFAQDKPEMVLSRSPQSTLSGIGNWCGRSTISSDGSPNGPSQVPSPPTTPFGANNDTWDLIYEAAGQVARLKINAEETKFSNHGKGLLGSPVSPNPSARNPNSGLYTSQILNQNPARLQPVRPDQAVKSQCSGAWGRRVKAGWLSQQQSQQQYHQQQIRNRGRNTGYESGRSERPLNLPQSGAWRPQQVPPPQHNNDTAMRAVLLGGAGVKRESAGTGVFLPRRYGNPPESRKKTGVTTVLLPAKVVQALNLNFEAVNGQPQPRLGSGFASDHEALMARRNVLLAQQRTNLRLEGSPNYEVRLPQEWTY
ncbi:hypothetical protein FNV43_RR24685 [Rhamnella rubrinervis]|uniref:Uncharacterized protein n=1 Tax=Rhamnella rubrinervis TaxID=2594499 RepID=A0A8K0DR07_9ROSA|nr:hypothetical protein FNV43_RR24685 [Rhamnella rubrinervis]